jgi:hypothetical protein
MVYERLIAMVQSELPISVPIYRRLGPHLFATTSDRSDLDTTSTRVGAPFSEGTIKLIAAVGAVGRSNARSSQAMSDRCKAGSSPGDDHAAVQPPALYLSNY